MNSKPTILYVDDEKINLTIMEINLKHNYNVITADSGAKALEIIKEHPETSVVISDMKMPQMNGIEFITTAKERYPMLNYFILTGFDITPEIQNAIESNLIIKYFKKPFNMKEIENEIDKIVKN